MASCEFEGCSGDDSLQRTCSYCQFSFCSRHRLPENHNCVSLRNADTLGPEFRTQPTSDGESSSTDTDELSPMDGDGAHDESRDQCSRCSSYVPPDETLCLECRRSARTLSSVSPDVNPDGTLERPTDAGLVESKSHSRRLPSRLDVELAIGRIARKVGYRGRIHQFFSHYRYAVVATVVLLLVSGAVLVLA